MARIKVLDEQLANQIAAGEVVERPASIVKELVENAVDAGSTTIDIAIEEGGLTFIRVIDNGYGIAAEDMVNAFQRHATSKISTSSDLFRIASLGFRGEALPSIAAVSRLQCVSSTESSGLAHRLVMEGGTITVEEPTNALQGTDITVRDLFYNTPARLKYMKAIQTELGHISDYLNRIALAHPGIAFTFKHNGNVLLRTLGTGDRLQVIAAVYGTNTAKVMLPIEAADADYELTGYMSKPELTRANRNGITVIVNGRYIRSHAVNQALLQAYHTLLPINRFPLAVLELGMHPSLLDVNVHPSKMEVRFSKESELRQLIERAAKAVLNAQRHIPGPHAGERQERSKPVFVQDAIAFHMADSDEQALKSPHSAASAPLPPANLSSQEAAPTHHARQAAYRAEASAYSNQANAAASYPPSAAAREYVPKDATERLYSPPASVRKDEFTIQETAADAVNSELSPSARSENSAVSGSGLNSDAPIYSGEEKLLQDEAKPAFPELYWIGQHHGTYIVAQAEDGLYLIDQHAAHERINYEYYLHKFGNPEAASQQLLVPITLEFTPGEAAQLRELLDLFAQVGVELEPFGTQTFLVRAYPEWMPKGEEQGLLEEMAELLISERKAINIMKLREKAAIMVACKASIKANDRMSREEGETLLARLSRCEQPYTCPHGRPIIVHLSTYQLEKMFKRVMS